MKFLAEDNQLTITFHGWEAFFALRRKLVIPRGQVTNLEWQPNFQLQKRIWRLAGTDIPLSLWAGIFYGNGKRYFFYVQHPPSLTWYPKGNLQNILSIKLQDNFYQQLLLTCDPDIGAGLLNWWKGTTRPE